jgi:hypothetical protein
MKRRRGYWRKKRRPITRCRWRRRERGRRRMRMMRTGVEMGEEGG